MAFRGKGQLFHIPNDFLSLEPNSIHRHTNNFVRFNIHLMPRTAITCKWGPPSLCPVWKLAVTQITDRTSLFAAATYEEACQGASPCVLYALSWSGHARHPHVHIHVILL